MPLQLTLLPLLAALMLLPALGQSPLRREENPIPAAVENIYTRGLRHLASTQKEDGSWENGVGTEPGVVGLAIMAFLAHGEDPNHGPYAKNISRSIDFILKQQQKGNGYIGSSMYSHGFATLALAEAYGMYRDPRIAPALKNAVNLILSAQKRNSKGAWRYSPDSNDADSSIAGCQIVALYAARNAGPSASYANHSPSSTAQKPSKPAPNISKKSSTTVSATTPTTSNTTWLKPSSTLMKKPGRSGTSTTPATSLPSNLPMAHSPEIAAKPLAPLAHSSHSP